jgi:two-component system OmpR family sensor kinase
MLRSEKRSLVRFLGIYFGSTMLLFFLTAVIFYNFQKHQIIDRQKSELNIEAKRITGELQKLYTTFSTTLIYPYKEPFESAIYNLDREYIFGSFQPYKILWEREYYQQEGELFYIYDIYPYYLGASYLVISKKIDQEPIDSLFRIITISLIVAGVFFAILGLFLGRLFIAPMRESIENINRFIEDTTNELNTPISTILTNIELIFTLYNCEGREEMRRIEIASKNLSRLYEDLSYLKLNHNYHRAVEELNISLLVLERIDSFKTPIEVKELNLILSINQEIIINIDKNDAIRMIDNLLSNAIKYNKRGGELSIVLTREKISIKNSGRGIKKEDIDSIQNRFSRANRSEGGFGIGLDIVAQVVTRYCFGFRIESTYNKNTEVTIKW